MPVSGPTHAHTLFSLGLIADVQYAAAVDGWNYGRTVRRAFRGALVQLRLAVDWWNAQELAAVAQLGDLIDGRNAETGESDAAMKRVMRELRRLSVPVLHTIGNHDLYNFDRSALAQQQGESRGPYYSFLPAAGWRILVLDSYQQATIGWPEGDARRERALELLRRHNPNDVSKEGDWFAGLSGLERRWVPFNGALGDEQLAWLRRELRAARQAAERVLVLSHAVLHPAACDGATMLWDFDAALAEIARAGVVAAVIAGHDHSGGYHRDEAGVHHLTLCSPLNTGAEGSAYGALRVSAGGMQLCGPGLADLLPQRAALPRAADLGRGCPSGVRLDFAASGAS